MESLGWSPLRGVDLHLLNRPGPQRTTPPKALPPWPKMAQGEPMWSSRAHLAHKSSMHISPMHFTQTPAHQGKEQIRAPCTPCSLYYGYRCTAYTQDGRVLHSMNHTRYKAHAKSSHTEGRGHIVTEGTLQYTFVQRIMPKRVGKA